MTDERYERYIKRIKRDAIERDNFTKEQMNSKYLDGFDKMTKSPRIMRLITLAYYRGMMRGIDIVKQGEQIVTLN